MTVNCLHPGTVATNIWSRAPWFARPLLAVAKRFMLRPEEGARAIVYLTTSPDLEEQTGGYYEKGRPVNPSPSAQDEVLAKRLWEASSKLVKLA